MLSFKFKLICIQSFLLIFIFRFLFHIRAKLRLSRQFAERSFSRIRRFYRKPLPYFWNHPQGENYSSKWKFIAALYARARTTVIAIMALSRLTSPTGVRYYAVRGFGSESRGGNRPTEQAHEEEDNVHDLSITCAGDPNFLISSIGSYTRTLSLVKAIYSEDYTPLHST